MKNNVEKLREAKMLTKNDLAKRADVNVLTIYRIEQGESCRESTQAKIAKAFDAKLEEVFPSPKKKKKLHPLEAVWIKKGYNLESFARQVELVPETLSRILKGTGTPRHATKRRIMDTLGIDYSKASKYFNVAAKATGRKDKKIQAETNGEVEA